MTMISKYIEATELSLYVTLYAKLYTSLYVHMQVYSYIVKSSYCMVYCVLGIIKVWGFQHLKTSLNHNVTFPLQQFGSIS